MIHLCSGSNRWMALVPPAWMWNLPCPGICPNLPQQFILSCPGSPLLHTQLLTTGLPLSPIHSLDHFWSHLSTHPGRLTPHSHNACKPGSADATSLNTSFRKTLSTTKRVIALANNNLFAGFYVVRCFLYAHRKRIRAVNRRRLGTVRPHTVACLARGTL